MIRIVILALFLLTSFNSHSLAGGGGPGDECIPAASPAELWPPNHKFVEIEIFDLESGETIEDIEIISVEQDEPLNGLGDGNTCPDALIYDKGNSDGVSVRSERTGNPKVPGNGRVYIITFEGDVEGELCEGEVMVCVPHDQRKGHECVLDETELVDSTGPCEE